MFQWCSLILALVALCYTWSNHQTSQGTVPAEYCHEGWCCGKYTGPGRPQIDNTKWTSQKRKDKK